jgi:hypothetical protein
MTPDAHVKLIARRVKSTAHAKVPDRIERAARTYQETLDKRLTDGRNYTELNAPDRWYWGYIGEAMLSLVLDQCQIPHRWNPRADGHADGGDLIVGPHVVDAKCASQPHHRQMMTPESQFDRHRNRTHYAGLKSDGRGGVTLYGGCRRPYMLRFVPEMVNVLTRQVPLASLEFDAREFMLELAGLTVAEPTAIERIHAGDFDEWGGPADPVVDGITHRLGRPCACRVAWVHIHGQSYCVDCYPCRDDSVRAF